MEQGLWRRRYNFQLYTAFENGAPRENDEKISKKHQADTDR